MYREKTKSHEVWHRRQSPDSRQDKELMEKSQRTLENTKDPVVKLRMICLSRGASGIVEMGRIFRRMDKDGSRLLKREDFFKGMKEMGLDVSEAEAEEVFMIFDTEHTGSINIEELIKQIRPPMSDSRRNIVEQAFRKMDKTGEGTITVNDLRRSYSVSSNLRYKSGEETADVILNKFIANFEAEGMVNGKITLEEFMNYYSGISESVENDCNFDLMMRQAYKL